MIFEKEFSNELLFFVLDFQDSCLVQVIACGYDNPPALWASLLDKLVFKSSISQRKGTLVDLLVFVF